MTWGFLPVEGPGVTASQTHSTNGGITMGVKPTRPNIETRTPTAYGELKTYIEFDFNQTGGTQLGGNADLVRLRQAYGTLGPWLIGQADTLFSDPQSWPDTANGAQGVGIVNSGIRRKPQIRYTWLAGNGLSFAGSAEYATYNSVLGNAFGVAANGSGLTTFSPNGTTGAASTNGVGTVNSTGGGYVNWPRFAAAAEWDQPWGHIRFEAGGGVNEYRNSSPISGSLEEANLNAPEWVLGLSGHLNTWGKDALRGALIYSDGAADFGAEMPDGGTLINTSNGQRVQNKMWAGYANYEHFFNGQWRANEAAGYAHLSGNPGFTSLTTLAALEREHFSNDVNVIYSPVPQTDFIMEWEHVYRKVQSNADVTDDRLDAQFKFYF
jgi:Porin subfamily